MPETAEHKPAFHGSKKRGQARERDDSRFENGVPSSSLREVFARLPLAEGVQIASGAELHDEARELLGLEMSVESGEERVIQQSQYLALRLSSQELLPAGQRALVHNLHGEVAVAGPQLGQIHTTDVSATQSLQKLEVTQSHGAIPMFHGLNRLPPLVIRLVGLVVPAIEAYAAGKALIAVTDAATRTSPTNTATLDTLARLEPPAALGTHAHLRPVHVQVAHLPAKARLGAVASRDATEATLRVGINAAVVRTGSVARGRRIVVPAQLPPRLRTSHFLTKRSDDRRSCH